jgi:predicted ATPase
MTDLAGPSARARARPSSLAGRECEQAALREALAGALAGQGGLVLIGGEAGIGKTAPAEALCAEAAEHGALALVGRCYDLSETPPYGPWAVALARLAGASGPGDRGNGKAATGPPAPCPWPLTSVAAPRGPAGIRP